MRRRLSRFSAAWPLAAHAQDGRTYHIGVLHSNPRGSPLVTALFDELRRNGFVEGRNLVVDDAGLGFLTRAVCGCGTRDGQDQH